jgi:protein-tyrosine phosphatase
MKGAPKPASLRARWQHLVRTSHGNARGWLRSLLAQTAYVLGGLARYTSPPLTDVGRLVFVCVGNVNRSAFAEAVARRRGIAAVSFGLAAPEGVEVSARALQRAADFGIDLGSHVATDFSEYEFQRGDLLLAMETRHVPALIERGVPRESIALRIHLHDPHRLSDLYLRTCFTLIHSAVHKLADELAAAGSACIDSSAGRPHVR